MRVYVLQRREQGRATGGRTFFFLYQLCYGLNRVPTSLLSPPIHIVKA